MLVILLLLMCAALDGCAGSAREQLSNAVATVRGFVQLLPPSTDRTIWIRPRPGEPTPKA